MFGAPDICLCQVLQSLWASQPSAREHPGPLLRVQVHRGPCRPGWGALRPVLCPREGGQWHSRSSQKSSPDRPSRAKLGMEPPLRPPCSEDTPLAPRDWLPEPGPQAALSRPLLAQAGKSLGLSVSSPRRQWHHRSPLLRGVRKGQAGDRKVHKQTPLAKQNQTDTETSKSERPQWESTRASISKPRETSIPGTRAAPTVGSPVQVLEAAEETRAPRGISCAPGVPVRRCHAHQRPRSHLSLWSAWGHGGGSGRSHLTLQPRERMFSDRYISSEQILFICQKIIFPTWFHEAPARRVPCRGKDRNPSLRNPCSARRRQGHRLRNAISCLRTSI